MRSINCRCFKSSAAYISINLAPKRTGRMEKNATAQKYSQREIDR